MLHRFVFALFFIMVAASPLNDYVFSSPYVFGLVGAVILIISDKLSGAYLFGCSFYLFSLVIGFVLFILAKYMTPMYGLILEDIQNIRQDIPSYIRYLPHMSMMFVSLGGIGLTFCLVFRGE